ncbi:CobW family GTP-binding protein [Bacillus sp. FJAT-45350]|uniref:CobW family GTP-binding protein n=1 Tax=Bacillus sp. FJAT-45350 TaxID=2011014 RepID=UPI000BB8366F|nr:GTP-binding protein [Bacillus sp. FJAT-45350]
MSISKIPVYLITGFLGSGKTTVLTDIVKYYKQKGLNAGVVLNELGEVNVEKDLFQDDAPMIELLNGCICCTIQDDLTNELDQFIQMYKRDNNQLDVLLIEGTGVANPAEVIEALTHPQLINDVEIKSVISLIDASRFLEYQSIFSSSKDIRTVLKQQVTNSTLTILNKVDLVDQNKLKKVKKKITEISNSAELVEASYGKAGIDVLLKERMKTTSMHLKEEYKHSCCDGPEHEQHEGCSHKHEHDHPHLFQAIKFDGISVIDRIMLEKWLKQLPDTVVRAKGIVQLTETPRPFQFQYASGQLHLSKIQQDKKIDPCIIIIGHGLEVEKLRESFEESVNN